MPRQVVTRVIQDGGTAYQPVFSQGYKYIDLRYLPGTIQERKFLGFLKNTVTDNLGTTNETYYRQFDGNLGQYENDLAGRVVYQRVMDADGRIISSDEFTYDKEYPNSFTQDIKQILTKKQVKKIYDINSYSSFYSITNEVLDFDYYGNPTQIKETNPEGTKYTCTSYKNETVSGLWRIGYPDLQTIRIGSCSDDILRKIKYNYDDKFRISVEKKYLVSYDAENNYSEDVLNIRYQYDEYGNITLKSLPAEAA